MSVFKAVRVVLLLTVLAFVGLSTWHSRVKSTNWDAPLWVVIYPVNGDDSQAAQDYIDQLDVEDFKDIDAFMAEEAARYGLPLPQPVETHLADQVESRPPLAPVAASALEAMWWSLKLRYWAWRADNFEIATPDIRVFAVFHDPAVTRVVPNSVGLAEGLIAVAHVFAHKKMASSNTVVITHEMLHTLGATDKYDVATNYPIHPHGFAEPEQEPLLPQQWAEIMGGRLPVSPVKATIPDGLYQTLIGDLTAEEINWTGSD